MYFLEIQKNQQNLRRFGKEKEKKKKPRFS